MVIADQWLNNGELPSGSSWDDLYSHVLSQYKDINPKKNNLQQPEFFYLNTPLQKKPRKTNMQIYFQLFCPSIQRK